MIAVPARLLLMIPIRACLLLSDQQPCRAISDHGGADGWLLIAIMGAEGAPMRSAGGALGFI
jgi:hypothetical protein